MSNEYNFHLLVSLANKVNKDKRNLSARELRDLLISQAMDDDAQMRAAHRLLNWDPTKVINLFTFQGKKDWRAISWCLYIAAHSNRVDWDEADEEAVILSEAK